MNLLIKKLLTIIKRSDLLNEKSDKIKDIFIFDAHCDTAYELYYQSLYPSQKKENHLTFKKAKKGGLNAQIFAIYVNPLYSPDNCKKKALMIYNTLEKKIFKSNQALKVKSTKEMESCLKKGKLASLISLESGHIIENSLDVLEFFYSLGIRIMTLTHTKNTDWADSSGDKPKHDGLTKFGRQIIKKMDNLGMAIDVSHSSDKTVEDVLETSSMPIMASHSCCRKLCNIPRNIPDNLIKEIAENKGYIGVNFWPGFLKKDIYDQVTKNIELNSKWYEKEIKENEKDLDKIDMIEMEFFSKLSKGNDKLNLNSVIKHIVHIIDTGGIDCVGLGSDFDGIPSTPTDLKDVSYYPNLVDGLSNKGFNEKEIRKIMGLNLKEFLEQFD